MICNLTLTNFLFRKNMGLLVPPVRRPVSPTLHYRISSAEALWFLNCSDKRFEERLEGDYIESKHGSIILHGWEVTITRYQILSNKVRFLFATQTMHKALMISERSHTQSFGKTKCILRLSSSLQAANVDRQHSSEEA
ncbi:hypothetical protein NC651_018533 [Populus alba x Populus x berolinensis]|nr:hypothetical protein NC651_018533 [Populus alba x Populus x berolinensis]